MLMLFDELNTMVKQSKTNDDPTYQSITNLS